MLGVLNQAYDHQYRDEESAAMPLAGGIMQYGYQCGMIWGAVLAAGAQIYRQYGPGPLAESKAIYAAQRLVKAFRVQNKNINCMEITEIDKSSTGMDLILYFIIKGGTIGCFRRAAKYASVAFDEINISLMEKNLKVPSPPVSCLAVFAKRMGLSERHTVMAAGFAGGIGLCGGACGALGAAIWILSMKKSRENNGKADFNDPRTNKLIEKFLKYTDYEFVCEKIVGKKFENADDHAHYVQNGGCLKIIELLAAE